jgi:hypothetical protein
LDLSRLYASYASYASEDWRSMLGRTVDVADWLGIKIFGPGEEVDEEFVLKAPPKWDV